MKNDSSELFPNCPNFSTNFFKNQQLIPKKYAETEFFLNVSSYCGEAVIDIREPIDTFLERLKTTKVAIKDPTYYPIHILPIGNKIKYIIIPNYDETILKKAPAIAATVILISAVVGSEITARVKNWKKRGLAKRIAIFLDFSSDDLVVVVQQ